MKGLQINAFNPGNEQLTDTAFIMVTILVRLNRNLINIVRAWVEIL